MQLWIGVHFPSLCLEVFRPSGRIRRSTQSKALPCSKRSGSSLDAIRVSRLSAPACAAAGLLTLAPATVMHERDSAAEVNAVREVATGLLNLSPQVVIAEESTVLVDVSASLRLFGGIRSFVVWRDA